MQHLLYQALGLITVFGVFGAVELARGRFRSPLTSGEDIKLEVAVGVVFPALLIPGVLFLARALSAVLFPGAADSCADLATWKQVCILLLADDLTQYLWHRLSHTSWLWPLHRAHHSAPYMSVRVTYRNNFFYYALMPGLWLSGLLLFLGFGQTYLVYSTLKLLVIMGAHSEVRWDEWLYRQPLTRPLAWGLERLISTPATHFAHHALTQNDGVGHYRGNYGNLLFVWDLIFGTALITRRYPPAYGLPDDRLYGPERWYVQFLYPLFVSTREKSSLSSRVTRNLPPEAG